MDEARIIIDRLRSRIEGVAAENELLRSETEKAAVMKVRFQQEKKMLTERIAELEHRLSVAELTNGFAVLSGGAGPAKERVNKLLREVDKCIALMNR